MNPTNPTGHHTQGRVESDHPSDGAPPPAIELQLRQRTAELELISSVQRALAARLGIRDIYDLVGDRIRDLFDAQVVVIRTFDLRREVERWEYAIEKGARQEVPPRPLDGFSHHLLSLEEPLVVNDGFAEFISAFSDETAVEGETPRSAVFVPLVSGDALKGNISLQNVDQENVFTDADVRLLGTLANSMGIALENARLFDETNRLLAETEQRNAELAVINSIQEGLVAEIDIQGIYDLVGDRIRDIFDAQVVGIATFGHDSGTEDLKYVYEDGERFYPDPRPIDALRRELIKTRELILISEDLDWVMEELTGESIGNVPGTRSPKSAVYVPMLVGDQIRGYITLQNLDREHAFSRSDVRLLSTLANSMSIAVENARLFDETNRLLAETEQRNAELAVINSVQEGLVAEIDMQGIYDLVGDRIRDIFDAQAVIIATFDQHGGTEDFRYVFEDGKRFYPEPRPYDLVRQRLIDTRELIVINEDAASRYASLTGHAAEAVPGTILPKSFVFVPLVVGDAVRGYVSLQNLDREHAFSEADVRLLSTLANSMSIALENARLFDETNRLLAETEQRNAELAVINSVQEGLVAEVDMQGIYDLVGDRIRDIFDAQVVGIATFDHDTRKEIFKYLYEDGERFYPEPRPYDEIRQRLVNTRELLLINENADEVSEEIYGRPRTAVPGTRLPQSLLFVPLIVGESVRGYVTLQNLDREHAFSPSDVRLLSTLSNSMSIALENARLFDETNRLLAETEQRNAELAVINSVQEGLVAEVDMQGIYDLVGDRIRDIFDAQVVIIATFDQAAGTEEFKYLFEDGRRFYPEPRPYDRIRHRLIDSRELIVLNENVLAEFASLTGREAVAVPGTTFPKSVVWVPLVVGDTVRGYVSLQNLDREHAFSPAEVRLLSTLSNSMSIAIENARLFDETNRLLAETEQRNAELAVINSVQEGLVAELDMQGIYDLVGDRIRDIFDAQVVAIHTFDHQNQLYEFNYLFEDGQRFYSEPRPIDRLRQWIIDAREMIVVNEETGAMYERITGETPMVNVPGTAFPKSAVFVPMIVGNVVRGYITLQNLDREHAFTPSDVRLLSTLANSMSVALENARLFDETNRLLAETEQRNAELAVINSVQEGLVAEVDMQGIYDLVGDRIRDIFDAQVVAIATFDHATDTEAFKYLYEDGERYYPEPRELDESRRRLIETREMFVVNENAFQVLAEIAGKPAAPVPGTRLPQSLVMVPLIVGDSVRGYVTLQNLDREHAFSASDVRLLSTLANSMSVALENARLFDETTRLLAETEQRNAELAVLNGVQAGIVGELDEQAIYDLVGEKLRDLDVQAVVIATFDREAGTETFRYLFEDGQRFHPEPRRFDGIRQRLIDTRELILINEEADEVVADISGRPHVAVPGTRPARSILYVPLIVGDAVYGYVSLQNLDREHAFSDADVRLLTTLANSLSVALENARLFAETRQQAAELDTVNRISRALVAQLNFDTLVHLVGERMRETFKADIVYLALLDRDAQMISFPYVYGETLEPLPLGEGLTSRIILTGEPLLINTDVKGRAAQLGIERIGKQATSYLGVPIMVGSDAIGVISVQSTQQEDVFDEDDLRLLSTIAANVGIALQNAESYQKLNAALAELKRTQTQLVQQEKLASLGALTAGIAHEIKNPLNFINNFSQLANEIADELREELNRHPEALDSVAEILADLQTNASKIEEHGRRADSIVRSMLLHSRHGTGKREMMNLNALVEEYVALAYHGKRAQQPGFNVDIVKEIDPNVGEIEAVPQDLGRVLLNLVGNAFDAVTERSSLGNGTAGENYVPRVAVSTRRIGDRVEVRVHDNGPGIPAHVREKIFEPFFTTKPAGQGTGLGLSMSHEIITQGHLGTLEVESAAGEGTTFTIVLPVNQPAAGQ